MLADKSFSMLFYAFLWVYSLRLIYKNSEHSILGESFIGRLLFPSIVFFGIYTACLKLPIHYIFGLFCVALLVVFYPRQVVLSAKDKISCLFVAFSSLSISTLLLWWKFDNNYFEISMIDTFVVVSIFIVGYVLISVRESFSIKHWQIPYLVYLLAASFYCLNTAATVGSSQSWHNWSAYVGPANLLLSGAIPLYDFPMQYGLGPTYFISKLCAVDCWVGVWVFTVFTTTASIALAGLALITLLKNQCLPIKILSLVGLLSAFIFYTAYPVILYPITHTPSTVGPRFFPGLLMLYATLAWGTNYKFSSRLSVCLHAIWLASSLWSPEAFIQTSMIWCPMFILYCDTKSNIASRIYRNLSFMLSIFIGFVCAIYLIWWLVFNVTFDYKTYLLYILFPPGPLPINLTGVVLYLLYVSFLALYVLSNRGADSRSVFGLSCALLLYLGASSYFMGRSHENNALNLLPYAYLVVASLAPASVGEWVKRIFLLSLLSVIAFVPLLGQPNVFLLLSTNFENYDISPMKLRGDFVRCSQLNRSPYLSINGEDYINESDYVRTKIKEISGLPVEYYDRYNILDGCESDPWTVFHAPLNWEYVPLKEREVYAKRFMLSQKKEGWYVYDKELLNAQNYLKILDAYYKRVDLFESNKFNAIKFTPNLETK